MIIKYLLDVTASSQTKPGAFANNLTECKSNDDRCKNLSLFDLCLDEICLQLKDFVNNFFEIGKFSKYAKSVLYLAKKICEERDIYCKS